MVLVSELFVRVREHGLCSPAAFKEGFNGLAEHLGDLSVDIPNTWAYLAILLRGSGLDQLEKRHGRISEKTMDTDKLNSLFWCGFVCVFSVCFVLLAYCTTR